MTRRRLTGGAGFAAVPVALALAFGLATASPVRAQALIGPDAGAYVTIRVSSVISQQELASRLRAAGLDRVQLSSLSPNPANPYPAINRDSWENPSLTPIHPGWNGTAVRNGREVAIFVILGEAG